MATENKCKCTDCKFNSEGNCTASSINLDYGAEGGCECLSYQVAESSEKPRTSEEQASTLYGG